ncbi:MAG: putative porin [Crocinitomix sp.]|nr:putative porin [Crocinitomix sp.]
MNYGILNVSMNGALLKNQKLKFTFDYYNNLIDYGQDANIPNNMKNERFGYTTSVSYGRLKERNDWLIMATYGRIESFAAVDYFTQNDWARLDYSGNGSPDGRLTNFQGIRFTAGYAIRKNFVLKLNYYKVEQLVATGISKENGDRIRLDLDIKF